MFVRTLRTFYFLERTNRATFIHQRAKPEGLGMIGRSSVLVLGAAILGCSNYRSIDEPTELPAPIDDLIAPLELNMTRSKLETLLGKQEDDELVLVSPSRLAPGRTIHTRHGVQVAVAFDSNDRVFYSASQDERLRSKSGCGPGQSFAEVKARIPSAQTFHLPGFGTMVQAGANCWLVFDPGETDLKDDAIVSWIEYRNDMN